MNSGEEIIMNQNQERRIKQGEKRWEEKGRSNNQKRKKKSTNTIGMVKSSRRSCIYTCLADSGQINIHQYRDGFLSMTLVPAIIVFGDQCALLSGVQRLGGWLGGVGVFSSGWSHHPEPKVPLLFMFLAPTRTKYLRTYGLGWSHQPRQMIGLCQWLQPG